MSNSAIVQQLQADFGQGNIPRILNTLSDDITQNVHSPAIIPYAGIRKGKSGAMDFFNQVGASSTYEKFEPQTFIEEGDKVIAIGEAHFTTLATGKKGVSSRAMAWTLKTVRPYIYRIFGILMPLPKHLCNN